VKKEPPKNSTKTGNAKDLITGLASMKNIQSASGQQDVKNPDDDIESESEELKRLELIRKKTIAYTQKLNSPKPISKMKITMEQLKRKFLIEYRRLYKKDFVITEHTMANLEVVLYYFTRDQLFFQCKNLSDLTKPDFDKGLLIIGSYGCGKSSIMRTLESLLRSIPGYNFKGYSANEVVSIYESGIEMFDFNQKMIKGDRFFDDPKTEKIASRYGHSEVLKYIFEERSQNPFIKTYITCNYKEGEIGLEAAIDEFGERYGGRVCDRIYEMFNIIEFTGPSMRK
jgi:DNA replication protein DnaC